MLVAHFIAVDMQNAFLFHVKVDLLVSRPLKQMFPSCNGETRCFGGVVGIARNGGDELGKPAQLVPGRARIDEQRGVVFQHPAQAFDDRRPVVPHLCVGGRQLPTVGKRGFHGGVAMFFEDGDVETALYEGVGTGDASDPTANDGNALHESLHRLYERRAIPPANMFARRTPSVMEPERFTPMRWRLLLRWAE